MQPDPRRAALDQLLFDSFAGRLFEASGDAPRRLRHNPNTYPAPRSWGERSFGNLIYWNAVDKGGHFAAWEQPEIFSQELRAAFKALR